MNDLHPFLAHLMQQGLWAPPQRVNGHEPALPAAHLDVPAGVVGPRYAAAALADECREVAATAEGSRNHRLNVAAYKLGGYIALGWIAEVDVVMALRDAALAAGLLPGEINVTINSGLQAGQHDPRQVELRGELPDTTLAPATVPAVPAAASVAGGNGNADQAELAAAAHTEYHQRCVAEEVRKLLVRRDARRLVDAADRPARTTPEIATMEDLLSRPPQPVRWRIHDWLPVDGRVLLAAQYKAGKTTLTGNLARCLVDGTPWMGRHEVDPVNHVVILDLEMGERQLTEWLRDQRIAHPERITVVALRGKAAHFDILDPATRADWAAHLREHGAQYLILDCLRPVLDMLGLDEHRDAGRFLVAFDALLTEADITEATVVHHMGHTGERSRGDSRIRDWPDVEWRIVRQDDEPTSPRYIAAFGRDVDIHETQLSFDPVTRHLTLAGGSRRDAAARSALFDVIGVLIAAGHPLSGRQVESELAESEHTQKAVRDALKLGARQGTLVATNGPRRAILYSHRPSISGGEPA